MISYAQMFKVLYLLNAESYSRNMYMNYSILMYHQSINSTFWKMFKEQIICTNEEAGELSFSVLSRCTLGDTVKSKFEQLSRMYSLLHVYRQINQDMADDMGLKKQRHGNASIKKDSPEVTIVAAYFTTKIIECRNHAFYEYDGSKKSYQSKIYAQSRMIRNMNPKMIWQDDISAIIKKHEKYVKENMSQYWIHNFTDVFPLDRNPIVVEHDDAKLEDDVAIQSSDEDEQDEKYSSDDRASIQEFVQDDMTVADRDHENEGNLMAKYKDEEYDSDDSRNIEDQNSDDNSVGTRMSSLINRNDRRPKGKQGIEDDRSIGSELSDRNNFEKSYQRKAMKAGRKKRNRRNVYQDSDFPMVRN
jgi:hypothetical protein